METNTISGSYGAIYMCISRTARRPTAALLKLQTVECFWLWTRTEQLLLLFFWSNIFSPHRFDNYWGGFFTRNLLIRFLLQANNTSKSRVGMYYWEGRREGGKEGGFLPSRFHSGRKNSKGRNTTAQFGWQRAIFLVIANLAWIGGGEENRWTCDDIGSGHYY